MGKLFILVFVLGLTGQSLAKIVRFDVSSPKFQKFSLSQACQSMGYRELLLVEAPNNYQVDCMGSLVSALDFCKKKYPRDKGLLRGYVDGKKKQVICQSGSSAILGMTCDKRYRHFCKQPKRSCQRLKRIFAHRLNLDHQSVLKNSTGAAQARLNCYFSAATKLNSLINDPLKLPTP